MPEPPVEIRPGSAADHVALSRLWESVFPAASPERAAGEAALRRDMEPGRLLLVARQGDQIVGAVLAHSAGDRGRIESLAVAPEHRGEGIGRRLAAALQHRMARLGCRELALLADGTDDSAAAFFRALGFDDDGRIGLVKPLNAPQATPAETRIPVPPNLFLSAIGPADKPDMLAHLQDPSIAEATFRVPYPYRESDADRWLQYTAEATAKYGQPVHFALRDPAGRLIGTLGFDGLVFDHRAEIGYWLAKGFRGKGVMTRAVRAARDFALTEWNLVRITAEVFEFNRASARVLEKAGFQKEGTLRKACRKGDRLLDVAVYAHVR